MPPNTYAVGDELYLQCRVEDSSISPSIYWIREQETNITEPPAICQGKHVADRTYRPHGK